LGWVELGWVGLDFWGKLFIKAWDENFTACLVSGKIFHQVVTNLAWFTQN